MRHWRDPGRTTKPRARGRTGGRAVTGAQAAIRATITADGAGSAEALVAAVSAEAGATTGAADRARTARGRQRGEASDAGATDKRRDEVRAAEHDGARLMTAAPHRASRRVRPRFRGAPSGGAVRPWRGCRTSPFRTIVACRYGSRRRRR